MPAGFGASLEEDFTTAEELLDEETTAAELVAMLVETSLELDAGAVALETGVFALDAGASALDVGATSALDSATTALLDSGMGVSVVLDSGVFTVALDSGVVSPLDETASLKVDVAESVDSG